MIEPWRISPKLLNEGEHVVLSTRTHVKALLGALLVLLLIVLRRRRRSASWSTAPASDDVARRSARSWAGRSPRWSLVWFVVWPVRPAG